MMEQIYNTKHGLRQMSNMVIDQATFVIDLKSENINHLLIDKTPIFQISNWLFFLLCNLTYLQSCNTDTQKCIFVQINSAITSLYIPVLQTFSL